MVDEQIVGWIKDNLSKGYTIEQMKGLLLQRYSDEEVTDALLLALHPEPQAQTPTKPLMPKKMMWSMIISLGVAILLLFFLLSSPAPTGTTGNLAPPMAGTGEELSCSKQQIVSAMDSLKNSAFTGTIDASILPPEGSGEQPVTIKVLSNGIVDNENQKVFVDTSFFANSNELKVSTYVVDNTGYVEMSGKWTKKEVSFANFSEMNKFSSYLAFESTTLEGIENNHFSLNLSREDGAKLIQYFFEKMSGKSNIPFDVDFNKALKNMSIEYWVDDSCRIVKAQQEVTLLINSDSVSSSSEEPKLNSLKADKISTDSISISWDASGNPSNMKYFVEYFRIPSYECVDQVTYYNRALDSSSASQNAYSSVVGKYSDIEIAAAKKAYEDTASSREVGPIQYVHEVVLTRADIPMVDPFFSSPSEKIKPETAYMIRVCTDADLAKDEDTVCSDALVVKTPSTGTQSNPPTLTCVSDAFSGASATMIFSSVGEFSGFNSQAPIELPSAALNAELSK